MTPELLERSIVDLGDGARLQRVFRRAEKGERVVLGVIGGSITQGASATKVENRWANRLAQWWSTQFPKAKVELVNAGLGATGSGIAAHRAGRDLLSRRPDVVVVEFGVNDRREPIYLETLEGLLRQILSAPKSPAVVLFFTMLNTGGNLQDYQLGLGKHYRLPMASVRDAVWPEIEAGRLKWADYSPDTVHPNDWGHECCAACIAALLERVRRQPAAGGKLRARFPLPPPLHGETFRYAKLWNAETFQPVENSGWQVADSKSSPFGLCWQASTPGSRLVFEVDGESIGLLFHVTKGPMGIATAQVDESAPRDMNGWFAETWGGYSHWEPVGHPLPPGKHRVRIELTDRKAELSEGHQFELRAVLAAGPSLKGK